MSTSGSNLQTKELHEGVIPLNGKGSNLQQDAQGIELSVVIPCLNEEDTVGHCVELALRTMDKHSIVGEVVVADNGSVDRSAEVSEALGARVVHVKDKGYGQALMGGIEAANGMYVIMGDADGSYDFAEIPNFLAKLREGNDLVQGCRLPAGGGTVAKGAMPFLHRWLGNPLFSYLAKLFFKAPINDINCGLRGFSKEHYQNLDQRCSGMEFAVEMVLKSSLHKVKIAEVPITLHPDLRQGRAPHLRTFRDGWRTLRFYLLSTPRWLFFYPGLVAILLGVVGYALAIPGVEISGVGLGVHTLLFSSLGILVGYQAVLFAVSGKIFAMTEGLLPEDPKFSSLFQIFTLEKGLIAGALLTTIGLVLSLMTLNQWWSVDFGALDYRESMRLAIPGMLLVTLGIQTLFASFFFSILGLRRA